MILPGTYGYEITGDIGDDYETEQKEIPYYLYVKDSGNGAGKIEEENTVTYYYRKLNFNFKVESGISSITLNGENVRIQNNKLAKIEIKGKEIANTELIVKYKIKVTNEGELAGTAKVVETIPNGYELLKTEGWKQTKDGNLEYNVELEAGESKTLELALKWENNEKNLGSKISIVKIEGTQNLANYEDTNKDDNTSTSTIIVSIKTGEVVSIIIIIMIISSLVICGYVTIAILKKKQIIKDIGFLKK